MTPKISKILYATDLSDSSRRAFQYALTLAQALGAKITVFHSLVEMPGYIENMAGPSFDKEKIKESHLQALQQEVSTFCEAETCKLENGSDAVEAVVIKEGNPAWMIINEAKAMGADLIVMGQHGHSAFTDVMIMGGNARRVVTHSQIPVLTVRLPKD